ncbi:hypothetical protein [Nannocystis pusilla]|uniref:hypothetical protein n=1 Tax=Nannocystis pusilla TaxID=889268 RepID=UPI003B76794D
MGPFASTGPTRPGKLKRHRPTALSSDPRAVLSPDSTLERILRTTLLKVNLVLVLLLLVGLTVWALA